jgi:hypothetical protein
MPCSNTTHRGITNLNQRPERSPISRQLLSPETILECANWAQKGPSKRLDRPIFGLIVWRIKVLPWSDPDQTITRKLVRFSCAARPGRAAAQLAHCWRICTRIRRELSRDRAGAIETRPVLADIPPPWLRLLGGEQGPQRQKNRIRQLSRQATAHSALSTSACSRTV